MSNDEKLFRKEQLLGEIWDEINSLKGRALDEYLTGIGLNPDVLLEDYAKGVDAAGIASKRARFEEARRHVRLRAGARAARIVAFDLPKKRQILAAISERAARTNEMTIAARNQKIDAEQDLDSFLEACVRLGLIDEDGNLKE
jgi:hypothetical protein